MVNPLDAITQTAHEIIADHDQVDPPYNVCRCGDFFDTCRSRVAAERIVQLAAELEAERYPEEGAP